MSEALAAGSAGTRTPWHLWLVAVLSLLWNLSGAITILMAQAGVLPDLSPDEAAYYAAQPALFVVLTDVALFTSLTAAIALLFRSRAASWLYGLALACILITNIWDLAAGTSRVYANSGALIVTCIIILLANLQMFYAMAMHRRGVLR